MTVQNNIDKIFKNGLSGYSEKAPAFIWDNIEQELNKKKIIRKRSVVYSIAASVALILSFGAGYLFTNKTLETQVAQLNKNTTLQNKANNTNKLLLLNNQNNSKTTVDKKTHSTTSVHKVNKTITPKQNKTSAPVKKSKKISSSGTLLPPMFASQSGFTNTNANANTYIESNNENSSEELNVLSLKTAVLKTSTPENGLIYEVRQNNLFLFEAFDKPNDKENNWAVGINGTPLLSYRNVQSTSSEAMYTAANSSGMQQNYKNEKPLIAYAAGVNINYSLNNRWNLQTGLYLSETGQIVENIDLAQSPWSVYNTIDNGVYLVNTSNGNIVINEMTPTMIEQTFTNSQGFTVPTNQDGESIQVPITESLASESKFIQKYEYYEIPIILSYRLVQSKIYLDLSGGISANFLASNNTYIQEGSNKSKLDAETEGIKSTSYYSIIGFGIEYPIVSNISIHLNPSFRYSLNSISNNGEIYPYSFGVFTGLRYRF